MHVEKNLVVSQFKDGCKPAGGVSNRLQIFAHLLMDLNKSFTTILFVAHSPQHHGMNNSVTYSQLLILNKAQLLTAENEVWINKLT